MMPIDDRIKWKRRRRKPRSSSALLVLFCVATVKSAPAARIRGTGVVDKRNRSLLTGPAEVVGGNGEWEDDDDDVETTAKSGASDSVPGASVAANTIQTGKKNSESTRTDGAWGEDDDEEPTSIGESNENENEAQVEAQFPQSQQLSHTTPIPGPAADANGRAASEDSWGDDDDTETNAENIAVEHAEVESPTPQTQQQSPTIPSGPATGADGPAASEDSWGDDDYTGTNSDNESVEHNAIATEEQHQMDQEETMPTVPTADETSDTFPSTIIDLEDGGDTDALMDVTQGAISQKPATNIELSTAEASDQVPSPTDDPTQSSAIGGDPNLANGDYDEESDITLGGQATTSVHRNQSGDNLIENNESGISAEEQPGQVATEDQVLEQTGQVQNSIPPNIANDWKGYGNEDDEEEASFLEMLSFTFNVILLAAFLTSILVIRKRVQERLIADSTIDAATALREEVTAMVLSIAAWSSGSSGEGADNAISRNASFTAGTGQSSFGQETVPLSTAADEEWGWGDEPDESDVELAHSSAGGSDTKEDDDLALAIAMSLSESQGETRKQTPLTNLGNSPALANNATVAPSVSTIISSPEMTQKQSSIKAKKSPKPQPKKKVMREAAQPVPPPPSSGDSIQDILGQMQQGSGQVITSFGQVAKASPKPKAVQMKQSSDDLFASMGLSSFPQAEATTNTPSAPASGGWTQQASASAGESKAEAETNQANSLEDSWNDEGSWGDGDLDDLLDD